MIQADAAHVVWARRLLTSESADPTAAAARVHDKLDTCLAPIIGVAGCAMLFARSAKLARVDVAALADFETAALYYATFFTLLATLVGERLTTQLLRKAWPDVDLTTAEGDPT